jgi:class 3 adenylate cyclase
LLKSKAGIRRCEASAVLHRSRDLLMRRRTHNVCLIFWGHPRENHAARLRNDKMPDAVSTHRLAAVLFSDVAGCSRMVAEDEEATLAALRDLRRNVLEPAISKGGGRIVKHMGDGFLAEFASAVTAVTTACALQEAMATANRNLPSDRQLRLRIPPACA